jgi:acetyltransferase-like isoleucine patch superfamily enzyme
MIPKLHWFVVRTYYKYLYNPFLIRRFKKVGKNLRLENGMFIKNPENMEIGENVKIGKNAHINAGGGLKVGNNTIISHRFTCITTNHDYKGKPPFRSRDGIDRPFRDKNLKKPVVVGDNVWIGINVTVIGGVKIGDNSIIGMGTVITKDVPKNSIVGSQPFRILKKRKF